MLGCCAWLLCKVIRHAPLAPAGAYRQDRLEGSTHRAAHDYAVVIHVHYHHVLIITQPPLQERYLAFNLMHFNFGSSISRSREHL